MYCTVAVPLSVLTVIIPNTMMFYVTIIMRLKPSKPSVEPVSQAGPAVRYYILDSVAPTKVLSKFSC